MFTEVEDAFLNDIIRAYANRVRSELFEVEEAHIAGRRASGPPLTQTWFDGMTERISRINALADAFLGVLKHEFGAEPQFASGREGEHERDDVVSIIEKRMYKTKRF
jgi:hypothetical protein